MAPTTTTNSAAPPIGTAPIRKSWHCSRGLKEKLPWQLCFPRPGLGSDACGGACTSVHRPLSISRAGPFDYGLRIADGLAIAAQMAAQPHVPQRLRRKIRLSSLPLANTANRP
jgi:hypothetical protein